MSSLVAGFKLIRPLNGLLALAALLVGVYLAGGQWQAPVLELLALFTIVSFGYVANDIYDLESDRRSKPGRPLPSGAIGRSAAILVATALLLIGVILATSTSDAVFGYFMILALLLFLYAVAISRLLLLSNILVAALCSSVFLLAGLLLPGGRADWDLLLVAVAFSFLHHLGREIIKDREDVAGDRLIGRRTVTTEWGAKTALTAGAVVYCLMIMLTYVAYFACSFSVLYLLTVTLGVNLPLLFVLGYTLRCRDSKIAAGVTWLLKITMITGLLALALARLN